MKDFLFSAIILLAALQTTDIQAQELSQGPKRTPQEMAQKQTERLQRDLMLTAEQRDTIYKIHLKYANMRTGREEHGVIEQRMKMMSEELLPLLNAEQQTKYRRFMSEIGPKRQTTPRMRMAQAVTVEAAEAQPSATTGTGR